MISARNVLRFFSSLVTMSAGVALFLAIPGCPTTPGIDNNNNNNNDNQPPTASAEIGYTDEGGVSYTRVGDGEVMPLFTSGQGGSHMFVVLRAEGFPVDESGNAEITVHQLATLNTDGRVIHDFTGQVTFSGMDSGPLSTPERIVIFSALPDEADGQLIHIVFTLTSVEDPSINATIDQDMMMVLQP